MIEIDYNPEGAARGLVSLLSEYTNKLNGWIERGSAYRNPTKHTALIMSQEDFARIRLLYMRMLPALQDLAGSASQLIEHAELQTATRVELRLRLAELEAALEAAQRVL